jgi:uncharacterized membrane protein
LGGKEFGVVFVLVNGFFLVKVATGFVLYVRENTALFSAVQDMIEYDCGFFYISSAHSIGRTAMKEKRRGKRGLLAKMFTKEKRK